MPSASAGGGTLPTECTASTDCGTNNECAVFTCADSKCSVAYAEKGTACQASKACNGAGSCLLADGVDCTAKAECVSGFCEDARCCATSCGVCSTCAMAGMEGSCEPLPSGIADGLGCATTELCDGLGQCANGDPLWSLALGSSASQEAAKVAIDETGNIIVAGHFTDSLTIGATTLKSTKDAQSMATQDIFVAKLDSTGKPQWAVSVGGDGLDFVNDLALDSGGNILLVGKFAKNFAAGGSAAPLASKGGESDGFITKLAAATGAGMWSAHAGGSAREEVSGVSVDSKGRVAIVGYYNSASASLVASDGIATTPLKSAAVFDLFVGVLNETGTLEWLLNTGGSETDVALDVEFGPSGSALWFTGYTCPSLSSMNLNLGGGNLVDSSFCDAFVARFDADGATAFKHGKSRGFPSANELSTGSRLRALPSGGILVGGAFRASSMQLPGGTALNRASSFGRIDFFFASLDANLESTVWAFNFPLHRDGSPVTHLDVQVDSAGNPLIFSETAGPETTVLNTKVPGNVGMSNLVLTKLSQQVELKKPVPLYVRSWGGSADERSLGLAVAADGGAVMVGSSNGGFDFDTTLANQGATDGFVLRAKP